ncbi:hypothetical protein [Halostreptopolyspora alba]|uniref:Uncharacterized protein n=1 Tax=Halostreptopolyspora alba TaxID=2487137 RepID=A0A3N0EDV2_9ACTN|nr:hypothetical protein EFW17_05745 [Nocardiopsaceae bacterium YIM 96095]
MPGTLSVAIPEIVADDVCRIDGVTKIEGDRTLEVAVDVVATVRQEGGLVSVWLTCDAVAEFTNALVTELRNRLLGDPGDAGTEPRTDTIDLSVTVMRAAERITRDYRFTRDADDGGSSNAADELGDLLRTAAEQINSPNPHG